MLSEEENSMLTKDSNEEEIKDVVFSISLDFAPEPDGFSAAFYVQCWDIIKEDVTNAVLEFFQVTYLPKAYISYIIALIP